MADLNERLAKLRKVEQTEEFAHLVTRIGQLIENMHAGTFRVYDEDLSSLKEDSVADAAKELQIVVKKARKLQAELEG